MMAALTLEESAFPPNCAKMQEQQLLMHGVDIMEHW